MITTTYGSPGVAEGLNSSEHGVMVDGVKLDEAGRMTALRFPAGGNLWRTQSYYGWKEAGGGGMLASLKVGLREGGDERLSRGYVYNGFGEIAALREEETSYAFAYDGLGRLKSAYGRTYAYDGASRLTTFNGQTYGYGDAGPYHAVDRIGGQDRFDYDANGNAVKRNKGLEGEQALVWDAQNRLSQVRNKSGDLVEQYWYGVEGARVKKTSGGTTTYTFFAHYEEEVTGTVTTAVSHYSFGGLRFAVKRGTALHHLHGDHLGSTSLTTDTAGAATASRAYYAYGAERSSTGELQTDRTFTGQKRDATGLMYYNARYYDPALGTFVSPDSLVPDPGMVIDYNRFLYVRGNPLRYSDPKGFEPYPFDDNWKQEFKVKHSRPPGSGDRVARLISLSVLGSSSQTTIWNAHDWTHYQRNRREVLTNVISEHGIKINMNWPLDDLTESNNLALLLEGIVEFGYTVGLVTGGGYQAGLARIGEILGGQVSWTRGPAGWGTCRENVACALGRSVSFYNSLFKSNPDHVRATAVHEMAHVLHNTSCATVMGLPSTCELQFGLFLGIGFGLEGHDTHVITQYGKANQWEYWAEAVTDWVFKDLYRPSDPPPPRNIYRTTPRQRQFINGVFRGQ